MKLVPLETRLLKLSKGTDFIQFGPVPKKLWPRDYWSSDALLGMARWEMALEVNSQGGEWGTWNGNAESLRSIKYILINI